ncbi:hypothetical protein BDP55DRAFT_19576 [Colletotrichum godetiae]|uniref:Uncharacterized protein n=1 Tax=Colletotrichum godetiae TaxID=1209918 RepID=A0AAJ0F0N4_9PEZI|nr:uncharacterized protein BDP55DRAFT_19576 [Colletotrichum godetiae]KAK1701400.1 hypothetical protein BDP55DRAFT_19576 [Colletotrichum godetiae]
MCPGRGTLQSDYHHANPVPKTDNYERNYAVRVTVAQYPAFLGQGRMERDASSDVINNKTKQVEMQSSQLEEPRTWIPRRPSLNVSILWETQQAVEVRNTTLESTIDRALRAVGTTSSRDPNHRGAVLAPSHWPLASFSTPIGRGCPLLSKRVLSKCSKTPSANATGTPSGPSRWITDFPCPPMSSAMLTCISTLPTLVEITLLLWSLECLHSSNFL